MFILFVEVILFLKAEIKDLSISYCWYKLNNIFVILLILQSLDVFLHTTSIQKHVCQIFNFYLFFEMIVLHVFTFHLTDQFSIFISLFLSNSSVLMCLLFPFVQKISTLIDFGSSVSLSLTAPSFFSFFQRLFIYHTTQYFTWYW